MYATRVDLSLYKHTYRPEQSRLVQALWFFAGLPLLRCSFLPGSGLRCRLLRLFGAEIGKGVVIKPGVRVKYPWLLKVGDHTWIGEDCWIDNLSAVHLGDHVCVSQGAYFCTGNHDWSDPAFALMVRPILVNDGAWICARAMVLPGVTVGAAAILAAGSVATKNIPPFAIHAGNPAAYVGVRKIAGESEAQISSRTTDRSQTCESFS